MDIASKQTSNPTSTGGGGVYFEASIQALFLALMLTNGYVPCFPYGYISKITLQNKPRGYATDDLIVHVKNRQDDQEYKMLAQIKLSIKITKSDKIFGRVILDAWKDYNNTNIFTKNRDAIALITGPLSVTNVNDVRTILEWARHLEDAKEFIDRVEQAYISSKSKRDKLQAFRTHLDHANNSEPVSDENLFEFMRHFHLIGYDLDTEAGGILSLLHSLFDRYSPDDVANLWARLVVVAQFYNENGGTITRENLPDDLQKTFTLRTPNVMPEGYSSALSATTKSGDVMPEESSSAPTATEQSDDVISEEYSPAPIATEQSDDAMPKESSSAPTATKKSDWNASRYASNLAIANLLGEWNESNKADREIIEHLLKEERMSYPEWINGLKRVLQSADSPVSLNNGYWSITERKTMWEALGGWLSTSNLNAFKQCVVTVLTDRDSQFDLPADTRFAAFLYGKGVKYSPYLRKGMAESLALLGTMPDALSHFSFDYPESIAVLTIREIFATADWVLWGSLSNLLPTLAEAAPDEFLKTVEMALRQSPCPFDELFSQEGNGMFGTSYLVGLLWALENLAWDAQYLVSVCALLAKLASRDPGGNWGNRPVDSLATILLPWLPQTTAPIEKRKAAVRVLHKEYPGIAFKLVMNLLPNQHRVSMGSYKPSWRNIIPDNWKKGVTTQEYREQVLFYADCAVSMADNNISKLGELIDQFHNLPQPSFDKLIEVLSSDSIAELPEDKRTDLWEKLTKLILDHRYHSEAEWSLNENLLLSLEAVAKKLAPEQPINLYRRLFSASDAPFYEKRDDWEQQQKKIPERRHKALQEIGKSGGIEAIIQFAESVESPEKVGYALADIADGTTDTFLLPDYLGLEDHSLLSLISEYVNGRYRAKGWTWAEKIDKSGWSSGQIAEFLSYLPFTEEAWHYAAEWLGSKQGDYWHKVNVPFRLSDDMSIAIDKLMEYKRLPEAIHCMAEMHRAGQSIDLNQCVKALLDILPSPHLLHSEVIYDIAELIKILQEAEEVEPDDLFRVEWAYLSLLDGTHGVTPVLLENDLANKPEFFCEVIRAVYLSEQADRTTDEPFAERKNTASNVFSWLQRWHIPPGMQKDGSFNDSYFVAWLDRVKTICTESGHLKGALSEVGKVLVHSPPATDGLWINKTVAEALHAEDVEEMRRGFYFGKINSRGVHVVDPTGKPEQERAERYRQNAEDVENAGYWRFAGTMKDLAEYYEHEARRIQDEHKKYGKR